MVIDYKNKEQLQELRFTVNMEHGYVFMRTNDGYDGVTFRNFPMITVEDTDFTNCTFENTQAIEFSKARVKNCTFRNVSEIRGHYTDFHGCTFVRCCSQGPLLTIDNVGSVEGCTFETITALGDNGYVIYSVYGKKKDVREIKNCKFFDCEVESDMVTLCEYLVTMEVYKTEVVDNVDYESCSFDWNDGAIEIDSFELEVPEYDD